MVLLALYSWLSSFFHDPLEDQILENIERANAERDRSLSLSRQQMTEADVREALEEVPPGHQPRKILDWLYLGDRFSIRDPEALKSLNVGRALRLANMETTDLMHEHLRDAKIEHYLSLRCEDDDTDNIILQFPQAVEFIETARLEHAKKNPGANVLVFDHEGVSRAPTIVLAYLLHRGSTLHDAVTQVQRTQPRIFPNRGFFLQLLEHERSLLGSNSLKETDYPRIFQGAGASA